MLYSFGPFELDLATCDLRRDGHSVRLQPRVFGVLRYLIEHRDRVVGKQELIDALWGGYQINSRAVPWTISRARSALGDKPGGSAFIDTLRGHGYRFTAAVHIRESDPPNASDVSHAAGPASAETASLDLPFVGRVAIMQQLVAAFEAAAEGRGRLYLLSGEAGIGKTRCADELALIARRRAAQIWIGRCFQHGSAPAFWPFIQVLRAACADLTVHERLRADGVELLRELEPREPESQRSTSPQASSDGRRFWLLDRLSRWLCRSARSQVRVIVLEDVHCADESSLQVLSLLSPLLSQARVLVLATARDLARAPTRSAASLAARMSPCEQVQLPGFGGDDTRTFLSGLLGEQLAAELAAPLTAKTAGNPLFLREIVRVLAAQGSRALAELPLPAAVTEIISARLHELDGNTRALLDVASVIGEELALPLIQRASGLPASEVLAGLQAATLLDIVERRPDGLTHAFVHPLMREVLYAALSNTQRANMHAAVGLALEALGVTGQSVNELAYHFHHAPLEAFYERARRYGRLAGDAAMRGLAYHEAAQCYAWARDAHAQLAPDDVRTSCDLLLISAYALGLAGQAFEARNLCERAIRLASDAGLADMLVRAARQRRPSVWLAHVPDPISVQALESALRLLPETPSAPRARAYAYLALFPPNSLNVDTCQDMGGRAVGVARELRDPQLMLEVQAARLFDLCRPTSIDEQLAVANSILQQDPKLHPRWAADALFARYHAFMQRGDGKNAERALDDYARLTCTLRISFASWHCERLRAQRMLHAGNLDAAERRFAELQVESQRMQLPLASFFHSVNSMALSEERSGVQRLREHRDVVEIARWLQPLPGFRALNLVAMIEEGELASAARELRSLAEHDFETATADVFVLGNLVQLASAAFTLHDSRAARVLRDLLAPYSELVAVTVFTSSLGSVSRYLGLLEQLLGRRAEAQRCFERAIERNARCGHELERLRASLGLAGLLAQGRVSERAEARKLAKNTGDAAQTYGAHMLAQAARKLSVGPASRSEH